MNTPEDRLKQHADRLKAQKAQREREKQEEAARAEKDLQERAATARVEQQAWRNRVEQLIEHLAQTTGQRVPFSVDETHEGAGFDVTVGTARIRWLLASEGWRVVDSSPTRIGPSSAFPLLNLAPVRDQTLEDLVKQGLRLHEG